MLRIIPPCSLKKDIGSCIDYPIGQIAENITLDALVYIETVDDRGLEHKDSRLAQLASAFREIYMFVVKFWARLTSLVQSRNYSPVRTPSS